MIKIVLIKRERLDFVLHIDFFRENGIAIKTQITIKRLYLNFDK